MEFDGGMMLTVVHCTAQETARVVDDTAEL